MAKRYLFQSRPRSQRGVTLIEVLVAVVILSLGFLATTRMQILGMRYNQGAFFKSQASIMATDIADRMRANLVGVTDNHYDDADTSSLPTDPDCMSSGCSPEELADLDIVQWGNSIQSVLPEGKGTITVSGGMYEIQVSWKENIGDGEETPTVTLWLNP